MQRSRRWRFLSAMARYFFHVHDDRDMPDAEGVELRDDKAAWDQAVTTSGAMLRDLDGGLRSDAIWQMEVRDEADRHVFTLRFSATWPSE